MLILTVLAGIFLAWQIYSFIRGDAPAETAVNNTPMHTQANTPTPSVEEPPAYPVVQELPKIDIANPALNPEQREYLNLVTQYQLAKIRRQLLEEEAAVAAAKRRIMEAEGKNLEINLNSLPNASIGNGSALVPNLQLIYVDHQAGEWSATINQRGQYREVHLGTQLPDGSRITAISQNGVALNSPSGEKIFLSFQNNESNMSGVSGFEVNTVMNVAEPKKVISIPVVNTANVRAAPFPVSLLPTPAQTQNNKNQSATVSIPRPVTSQ